LKKYGHLKKWTIIEDVVNEVFKEARKAVSASIVMKSKRDKIREPTTFIEDGIN